MTNEKLIREYFQSWITNDITVVEQLFATECTYSECYGPVYHGKDQILQWFSDWHKIGSVLEWTIKRFIHEGSTIVAEWYFKCDYNHEVSAFDGVSIIEFDPDGKIINLKEFESKCEHYTPYES